VIKNSIHIFSKFGQLVTRHFDCHDHELRRPSLDSRLLSGLG